MKYKIFVSGAQKELKKERRTVKEFVRKDVLLSEYFDVFLFEDSPAKSKPAQTAYIALQEMQFIKKRQGFNRMVGH